MADGSLTPTRAAVGSNVFNFSTARAAATVVDGVLNYPMLASRLLYKGKSFSGDGRSEQPTIIKDLKKSPSIKIEIQFHKDVIKNFLGKYGDKLL